MLLAGIRHKAGIRKGHEVLIEVDEHGFLYRMKKPDSFTAALRNLHSDIWKNTNPISQHTNDTPGG